MASSLLTHAGRCRDCNGTVALERQPAGGFRFRCQQCGQVTPARAAVAEAAADVHWEPLGTVPRLHLAPT